jgi:hypothetical protein
MTNLLFALIPLLLVAALVASRLPLLQKPTRRSRGNNSRNRAHSHPTSHPRRVHVTAGLLAGTLRPSTRTTCARCRGPILPGEDCYPTHARNRPGLICPGCYLR